MQNKHEIGILGATGMVGQRFIQLLENHPWFRITWLAASDRSSGKKYEDAAKWRLDTPCPERIARMTLSPADPEGAPKILFAALDADIAREMEPRFAAAGCAVVSNSSAFRMHPNVPLVIPEVNASHLHLIEDQTWRRESGGYIVTNPNCSAIGLVLALKPIEDRFGIECGEDDFGCAFGLGRRDRHPRDALGAGSVEAPLGRVLVLFPARAVAGGQPGDPEPGMVFQKLNEPLPDHAGRAQNANFMFVLHNG